DGDGDRTLVDGRVAGPPTSLNLAVSAHHLAEQFNVLVIDERRPGGFAVHIEPASLVRLLKFRHRRPFRLAVLCGVRSAGAFPPAGTEHPSGFWEGFNRADRWNRDIDFAAISQFDPKDRDGIAPGWTRRCRGLPG